MHFIKRFLMALGAFALVGFGLSSYAGYQAYRATGRHEVYIKEFLGSFSETWKVAPVADYLGEPVRTDLSKASTTHGWSGISQLGRLVALDPLQRHLRLSRADRSVSSYVLKGTFENGSAMIQIAILDQAGTQKIIAFRLVLDKPADGKRLAL
ncbi:MAG: hypothetical protein R3D68_02770 [Hyphomicrobiaceae bacterium]